MYQQGPKDFAFVLYWIIVFTGLRATTLVYLLVPFARLCGLRKPKLQIRFAEQAWLFLYYAAFWTVGMVRSVTHTTLTDSWLIELSMSCTIPNTG